MLCEPGRAHEGRKVVYVIGRGGDDRERRSDESAGIAGLCASKFESV